MLWRVRLDVYVPRHRSLSSHERKREDLLGFLSPLLRTKRTNLVYTAVGLHMYIKQLLIDIGNKMAYLKCVKGITVLYEFIAALISFCYN